MVKSNFVVDPICLPCTLSPFCCQAKKLNGNRPKVHSALPLTSPPTLSPPLSHLTPLFSLLTKKNHPAERNNNNNNNRGQHRQQYKNKNYVTPAQRSQWSAGAGVVVVIIKRDK